MSDLSNNAKFILIGMMIISGASNTLVYKLQNLSYTTYDGQGYDSFLHPYMQCMTMFFGEMLCFSIFLYQKKFQSDKYEENLQQAIQQGKKKLNYFYLLIPAMSDLITSTLQYNALIYVNPSIYQMMRGGVILITALCSIFFLKRKLKKYHYFGCLIVLIGITMVGISNFVFASDVASQWPASTVAIGMILLIASLFTNGILFVSEEKLFDVFHMEPLQVVGTEGFWGFIVYLVILMPILTFVHCPFGSDSCIEKDGKYYFDRPDVYFGQAGSNGLLVFLIILGFLSIALFNYSGVKVTKYISSLVRSMVDVTRTLIIWIVGIIVTVQCNDTSSTSKCQWENTQAKAIILEGSGFLVLVAGNLIYQNVIKFEFLEEKKNSQLLADDDDLSLTRQDKQD